MPSLSADVWGMIDLSALIVALMIVGLVVGNRE